MSAKYEVCTYDEMSGEVETVVTFDKLSAAIGFARASVRLPSTEAVSIWGIADGGLYWEWRRGWKKVNSYITREHCLKINRNGRMMNELDYSANESARHFGADD